MDPHRLSAQRWRHILGSEWVGQQSFIGACELADVLRPRGGLRVLDAGSGDGAFGCWLYSRWDCGVWGFDPLIDEEMRLPGVKLRRGSIDDPPWGKGDDFDALISLDALQYSASPGASLDGLLRLVSDPAAPVMVSAWATRSREVADRWGFEPLVSQQLGEVVHEHGVSIRESPHFAGRISRQLESLQRWATEYVEAWGREEYDRRLDLESLTRLAVDRGELVQLIVSRRTVEPAQ